MAKPKYLQSYQGSRRKTHNFGQAAKPIGLCLLFIIYLGGIIIGALIAAGCATPGLGSVFLLEMSTNKTYAIELRVGYFGGCLSVANSTTTSDESTEEAQVHCVANMRSIDLDDLGKEFWEDLNLSSTAKTSVLDTLNVTLPYAAKLQTEVFSWPPPVLQIAAFFVSGLVLLVGTTAISHTPAYKSTLLVGSLLGAFALGLALTASIASTQALNALSLAVDDAKNEGGLGDAPFSIRRGNLLITLSGVLVAFVTVFYVVIGVGFAQRTR
ncbi:hypothetical protein F5Y14DRAFT_425996 [Nemania sp. NC0429]|nr:hypothetical protein F5Y14DRAFT_425996 [Nemania sp. NC0429]